MPKAEVESRSRGPLLADLIPPHHLPYLDLNDKKHRVVLIAEAVKQFKRERPQDVSPAMTKPGVGVTTYWHGLSAGAYYYQVQAAAGTYLASHPGLAEYLVDHVYTIFDINEYGYCGTPGTTPYQPPDKKRQTYLRYSVPDSMKPGRQKGSRIPGEHHTRPGITSAVYGGLLGRGRKR